MICEEVNIKCTSKGSRVNSAYVKFMLLGTIIKSVEEVNVNLPGVSCVVESALPDLPCMVSILTEVAVRTLKLYDIKAINNVVVIRRGGSIYVYDKDIFNELKTLIVDPLANEDIDIHAHGYLLIGLPGVGKTQLARLLADMSGAYVVELNSAEILSKWLGESEKRMRNAFNKAREHAPSLILLNDFDTLLSNVRSIGEGDQAEAYVNLMNIFNTQFDAIVENNEKVIVIATTNKGQRAIEGAIARRLVPIAIPPPSLEAIKAWINEEPAELINAKEKLCKGSKCEVEDFIIREVRSGATWGYVIDELRRAAATGRLHSTFNKDTVGYFLLAPVNMPPQPPPPVASSIKSINFNAPITAVPTIEGAWNRITSIRHSALARFLTFAASMVLNKHVVVLRDYKYIHDAVAVTQQLNGLLLAAGVSDLAVIDILANSDVPVLFEVMPPNGVALPINIVEDISSAREWLTRGIASFYGVDCPDSDKLPMPNTAEEFINYAHAVKSLRLNCRDALLYRGISF